MDSVLPSMLFDSGKHSEHTKYRVLVGTNFGLNLLILFQCVISVITLLIKAHKVKMTSKQQQAKLNSQMDANKNNKEFDQQLKTFKQRIWHICEITFYSTIGIGLCTMALYSDLNDWPQFITNLVLQGLRLYFVNSIFFKYGINEFIMAANANFMCSKIDCKKDDQL